MNTLSLTEGTADCIDGKQT